MEKKCFKCNEVKVLTEFYAHKQMGDGHLNKCKDCTKRDTQRRLEEKLKDPVFVENEQARHREKYYRLGYKEKHKPSKEDKKRTMDIYKTKYPEKIKAKILLGKKLKLSHSDNEFHHWSYNIEHAIDVIELHYRHHAKAHRFIVYDQERFMYRRTDNMELLDTKEKHLEYITHCINTKRD